jgi:hypothetical protein
MGRNEWEAQREKRLQLLYTEIEVLEHDLADVEAKVREVQAETYEEFIGDRAFGEAKARRKGEL